MKFIKYDDPGHGWLKVSRKFLMQIGIADKISSCSYMRGDFVYLEEDCDLTLFVKKMEELGKSVDMPVSNTNKYSKIRGYDSYMDYTWIEIVKIEVLKDKMLACKNWSKKGINKIKNASLSNLEYWQGKYSF